MIRDLVTGTVGVIIGVTVSHYWKKWLEKRNHAKDSRPE